MRKIIHIDMDCFYAAIEERDNPALRGRPVGVAGSSRRSVLTTANYEARKYGCRSAMPVFKALELCPHLLLVPVRFDHYRAESARIRAIFGRFTAAIEPLSLDEAYLDVSHLQSGGAAVAPTYPRPWSALMAWTFLADASGFGAVDSMSFSMISRRSRIRLATAGSFSTRLLRSAGSTFRS